MFSPPCAQNFPSKKRTRQEETQRKNTRTRTLLSQSTNAPRIKPSDKERERDLRRRLLPKYDAEEEEEEERIEEIIQIGIQKSPPTRFLHIRLGRRRRATP
jgi:hypothetical protein